MLLPESPVGTRHGPLSRHRRRRSHYPPAPTVLLLSFLACGSPSGEPESETPVEPANVLPVGGSIARPERIRFEPPRFPESARARGEEGLVIVELTLDTGGAVSEARALRGAPDLSEAAVAAAQQWVYEPTLVEGEPTAIRFAETVRFVLRPAGGFGMRLPPEAVAAARAAASFPDWEISGHAFTACPCDTPCPCRSNAPPSHPPCHATTATRIETGHYGDTDLSGAEFVTLGPETWVALYFDEVLTEARRDAILGLFASLAPGAPQRYRAIRRGPLDITTASAPGGVVRRAVIPGVLEMESLFPADAAGALLGLIPGMDVWSNRLTYGRTSTYRYRDPSVPAAWDHSGRQSNAKEFALSLDDYRNGRMLIQHADGSGDWTAAQRAIFACPHGGTTPARN